MKIFILTSIICFSGSLLGQGSANLIQNCQGNWHCQFKELTLAPRQNYETKFEVSYSYKCLGHTLDLGVEIENGDGLGATRIPLILDSKHKVLSFEGLGPVKTRDFNPKRTDKAFLNNCYLEVHDFKVLGLSPRSIESLKQDKSRKEKELKEINTAVEAFKKAITYQRMFQVMQQTCERIYTELSSENLNELTANIKSVSSLIPSLLAEKASVLSPAEISALAKFLTLANSATETSSYWQLEDGRARKLEELLSEEDKIALQSITDKFLEDKTFIEEKLKELASRKRHLEAEIKKVEKSLQ